jgi:competence protein ComEC
MNRPIIPIVISYALGLLAAHYEIVSLTVTLFASAFCFPLFIAAFYLKKSTASTVLAWCLFSLLGFILLYPSTPAALRQSSDIVKFAGSSRVNIEGIVDSTPEVTDARTRLYVTVSHIHEPERSCAARGRLQLTIKTPAARFHYGDRIRFFCAPRLPRNFENPGMFDYVRYLSYRGIAATAFLEDDRGIITLRTGQGSRFLLAVERARDRIREELNATLAPPSRDVLKALIIGEQDTIPDTIREQFSRLGLSHLLSISGLHVSMFALLSYFVIMSLFRAYPRTLLYLNAFKWAVFFSIFPVLLYCCIAGFNIPTLRSAIMVICYLVALLLGRREDLLHTLFLAALITLVCIPASLFDISFQLSYMAVLSIVVLVPRWQALFPEKEPDPFEQRNLFLERCRRMFRDSLLSSAAAILGTAPLVAMTFHYFSVSGFFTNIIMIPVVTFLIVPLSLLAAGVLFISPTLSAPLFSTAGFLTDICLNCTAIWSQIPCADFRLSTPRLWEITIFYLLLAGFSYCAAKKKLRYFVVAAAVFACIETGLFIHAQQGRGVLSVTILDVGAGNSALVEFPGGHTMLIDGGGFMDESIDIGEAVIAPVLYCRGIRCVDYLVLTHPHKDHTGGLPYIAENFRVQELWLNGEPGFFASYQRLMTAAEKNGIAKKICSQQSRQRTIDGVRIDFLSPEGVRVTPAGGSQSDTNNNSLVMKLTFNQVSFLFPADILRETEQRLIAEKAPLAATIILAPHHGGIHTSSAAFIRSVSPEVVVFSCRSYGSPPLPRPEVLAGYRNAGVKIYQTDKHGAIEVETDGIGYRLSAFKGKP